MWRRFLLPWLLTLLFLAKKITSDNGNDQQFVFTKRILEISYTSAVLSALAYETNLTQYLDDASSNNATTTPTYVHPDFDEIQFYIEEPDQAILAKKDGRCYLAFRGTNANFDDWSQNINLADATLFRDNDVTLNNSDAGGEISSCEGRQGFRDFLETSVVVQGRADLQDCYETYCTDATDCVVLTGHSQGGATATQASILLYSLTPIVVTFGQPPAVDAGCSLIPSQRYYRYVNSKQDNNDQVEGDVEFDPIVFSPAFVSKSVHYGHFILLGDDDRAIKWLGFDQNYTFTPNFFDRSGEIDAHTMQAVGEAVTYSYYSRIRNLLLRYQNDTDFTISTDGFSNGVPCDRGYHELCVSHRCGLDNLCADLVQDLCVKESCVVDQDCQATTVCIYGACAQSCVVDQDCQATTVCIYGACAQGPEGTVELDCPCRFDSQCESGECDQGVFKADPLDWICYNASSAVSWNSYMTTKTVTKTGTLAAFILSFLWSLW